jgi:hypothetical protein
MGARQHPQGVLLVLALVLVLLLLILLRTEQQLPLLSLLVQKSCAALCLCLPSGGCCQPGVNAIHGSRQALWCLQCTGAAVCVP